MATVMGSWRARESETQGRLRDANESTARARACPSDGEQLRAFRCECGEGSCTCAVRLTLREYESVRAYATHFVIARDHENPESEQVIEEHERFAIVEEVSGEAVRLARNSDPRHWHHALTTAEPGAQGPTRGAKLLNASWHEPRRSRY
jgi:hypothetical protein